MAFACGDPLLQVIWNASLFRGHVWSSTARCPSAIGFYPFRTLRRAPRKGQFENADLLSLDTSAANGDELFCGADLDAFDDNRYAQYCCFERHGEMIDDHCVEPHPLLRLVVCVDSRISDEHVELRPARWPTSLLYFPEEYGRYLCSTCSSPRPTLAGWIAAHNVTTAPSGLVPPREDATLRPFPGS